MDAMAVYEAGFTNVVSIPFGAGNTHWIEENWAFLEQFDSIIIGADNDEAGKTMTKEVIPRLGAWRCKFIDIPRIITDQRGKERVVKDFNEILYYQGKEAVLNLIANAQDSPVPSVEDFSDIDDVELEQIEGVYTGITALDKELMRLFFGTLTVVSGYPGSGKSSFLYQLICNALDQNVKTWVFSREFPDWMAKNWILHILAGPHNTHEYVNQYGAVYHNVSPAAKDAINDHYRERLYIYKDEFSNKIDDLMHSMEDVVRKYGVKFLILDNLMTIDIGANSDSENQKQTEAINSLIHFSAKYNVATILVCHPRKVQNTQLNMGMYDVAGSSNIINLAHRAIGLRRLPEDDPDGANVMVTVLKDRMRGRANFKLKLYYDVGTRRFYTTQDEYEHQYEWDTFTYSDRIEAPAFRIPDELPWNPANERMG